MRVNAEIKSNYESSVVATSVAKSLDVDNVELKNLVVKTNAQGKSVVSVVAAKSLATAFSTIEDLIRNQIVAEEGVM
ncbi:MAG: hypothetical protein GOV15_02890, partial [Candidatus Diapherotrites archaeon]|nr:hypothetical protein [Candidatus Diapherotrites archaeon]